MWIVGVLIAGAALAAVMGVVAPPPPGGNIDPSRATGTVGDANELAAALVAGLALAAAMALSRARTSAVRLACAAVIPLSLAGIMFSLSRGGLVALGAAAIVTVLIAGRWRLPATIAAFLVSAATLFYFLFLASLPAKERVTEVGTGTGRLDLWSIGLRMLGAHPVAGVGAGNFPDSSIHYLLQPGLIHRADFIITTPKVAHNTYLQVFAELGIPGGVLFLVIVATACWCTLGAARIAARSGALELEILARGVFVATAGFLTASFFISENYSKLMWLLLALGPALLAVARGAPDTDLQSEYTSSPA